MNSSHVSRSPIRERGSGDFDFDRVGKSPARQRNVSKSPLRERGDKTPVSVRTRDVTRSPMRGERTNAFSGGVSKSPARSMNGDIPGAEEEASVRKMTPTTNSWLPDDKHMGKSDDDYSGERRTWRDQVDRVDQISEGRKSVYSDEHRMAHEALVGNLVHGIDPSKEKMQREMRFRGDYVGRYAKSRETADHWVTRRDGVGVIRGNSKVVSAPLRTAYGRSSCHHESVYGYGDPRHSSESLRGPASLQDLELKRAELLQKYKELKDQLTNLDDKRFSSPGFYSGSNDNPEDESWRFRRGSGQQFVLDKIVQRPFHFNHGPDPVHHMEDEYSFAPPLYDDPFSGQRTMASRPNKWHQDFDQEPLESYYGKARYHHPMIGNDWQRQELPNSLGCGTSSNIAANFGSSQSLDLERHGPQAYNPRMAQTSPQERPSYFAHHHPRRVLATNLNKQLCHPISGGAPFVLCNKCFHLLKLPQRFMAVNKKNQHQLQCGACSAVMSCDLQNRSSTGLHSSQKKRNSVDNDDASGLDEVLKESGMEHHRNSSAATSTNLGSYDFDSVGCSFQSMDSETNEILKGQRSGTSVADSKQYRSPSPFRSSKEDHVSDNASVQSGTHLLPPPPGSPLQDPLAPYSYFGKPEGVEVKQITEKDPSFESSTKNTMDATEAEVHSNEVPTTSLSQDSGDDLREEDKAGSKVRKSSTPAFMKQGFVSRAGHGSRGRDEVYVNGQLIQHCLIKRAEKLAGPIQPGEYWYDSKAGFWGVMGNNCFGIIPPFIQEFSFPMPMNCSDGDTAVYINGRELHKRDLDLLTSRGLPNTRNKGFIIDISGKVLDEETKEFVVNLGKLAPTVERNRCGFGMQVPEHLND